eukprot:CAMPEP_0170060752 /NCGR_PEP_ID=MMETSP0019_2-20121128/2581_1 /TAXON_ID=98059 /ORGANISM="Dinobryon sp., Strain UTEXLB2267" /LENGTH=525 /DNA_ID=CAMNT_0010266419 /DNA_START=546 /DNA_END=2123 /DNA_ORIENTATION=-
MSYGLWATAGFFWSLVTSWMNDNLGVRNSLLAGFSISIASTALLVTTQSEVVLFAVLLFVSPLGYSIGPPMLYVGIKRYTTEANRSFAFGLSYSAMNAAAFCSGATVDLFNLYLKDSSAAAQQQVLGFVALSPNRLVLLATCLVYVLALATTFLFVREIQVSSACVPMDLEMSEFAAEPPQESPSPSPASSSSSPSPSIKGGERFLVPEHSSPTPSAFQSPPPRPLPVRRYISDRLEAAEGPCEGQTHGGAVCEEFLPSSQSLCETALQMGRSHTFWRYCLLSLLLVNLTWMVSSDALEPTYLLRCFGPAFPRGMVFAINPFVIVWLTPVLAATTAAYPHLDMIRFGGFLTAAGPFLLAASTSPWALVLSEVIRSLGEAIWSPKLVDYSMSIAPQGREASFASLSSVPVFVASIPFGWLSGQLIAAYLPEDGPRDCRSLWLLVGGLVISSPLLLTLLEPCVREPGPVTALSPLGLVLAAYQHLASRYPGPVEEALPADEERMACDCLTEAEQRYEDSCDTSCVCI